MSVAQAVVVIADHGSFGISLLFLGPVGLLLGVLGALTWRDRRSGSGARPPGAR